MPNVNNIESPVTLISYGRSGSSLISKVFELHPEFSMVGETGNFIGDLWRAYEFSTGQMAPSIENARWTPDDERAGRMVRSSMMSCFPDDNKQWFHKPIGVPIALSSKFSEEEWDQAAIWYWNMMDASFPKARFFTILRHPFDVVLSAKSYWGFDEESIWWNYAFMAYLLSHPACPITYAISFEDMILDPEGTIKSLFNFIGVPFDEKIMEAFATVHAASNGREQITSLKVTRKDDWSQLDKEQITPKYLEIVLGTFNKYRKNIELPIEVHAEISQQYNKKVAADICHASANNIDTQKIINEYNKKIELINSEHSRKLIKRENEFYEVFNKDQKWIAQLNESKKWLESERVAWESAAKTRDQSIKALQAQIEALSTGSAWLETERAAWEKLAKEHEQSIAALQAQVAELQLRLVPYG